MRSMYATAALAAGVLGLAACGSLPPERFALVAPARAQIRSTDVVAPIRQNEIYVFVPSSAAAGAQFGLIGALVSAGVDAQRSHNAENAVTELRNAAVDYDFDAKLRRELRASLSSVPWLKARDVKVIKDVTLIGIDKAIDESSAGAVLVTSTDYHLSNDGRELTVTLAADMFAKDPALAAYRNGKSKPKYKSDAANAIYRGKFSYAKTVPGATAKREDNMALWAADHGAPLKSALDTATAELSRQLAADISGGSVAQLGAAQATGR